LLTCERDFQRPSMSTRAIRTALLLALFEVPPRADPGRDQPLARIDMTGCSDPFALV